jgi:hypothetical protein
MEQANPFTYLGILLIILGLLFVAIPFIGRYVDVEKIPWVILWVYKSDGFVFATSPILIIISLLSLLLAFIRR